METKEKQPWFLCAPVARYKDIVFDENYSYDYRLQVILDIHDYCEYNQFNILGLLAFGYSEIEIENQLYDLCVMDDLVTGNSSGSYWCSTWFAELALCHNWDLLTDALFEFGEATSFNFLGASPEQLDVKIRIYLLGDCIHEYVSEIIRCYVDN